MDAATLGLELRRGVASIVPFKTTAALIVEYGGMIDLASDSGQLQDIIAEVVYANDYFEVSYGDDPKIVHRPPQLGQPRGEMLGVYASFRLANGGRVRAILDREEIEVIKSRAPGSRSSDSPWNGPFEAQMWKKTAIRRAMKLVPRSLAPRAHEAMQIEDAYASGERRVEAVDIDSAGAESPPATRAAAVCERVATARRRGRPPIQEVEAMTPAPSEQPADETPPLTEPDGVVQQTAATPEPQPPAQQHTPESLLQSCIDIWPARKAMGSQAFRELAAGRCRKPDEMANAAKRIELLQAECLRLRPDDPKQLGELCKQINGEVP
jgi:recombinational DNA repair protein RecT